MNYLLVGAVFLTIGAQASTSREVQTLSMPATFGQVLIFGFAAKSIGSPELDRRADRSDLPAVIADGDVGASRRIAGIVASRHCPDLAGDLGDPDRARGRRVVPEDGPQVRPTHPLVETDEKDRLTA